MRGGNRRCPICWQTIVPTTGSTVYRHWDSIGNTICPMSGERYDLAESGKRVKYQPVAEAVIAALATVA